MNFTELLKLTLATLAIVTAFSFGRKTGRGLA